MTASTAGSDDEEYVKGAIEIVKDSLLAPVRTALSKPARRAYIQTVLLLFGTFALLGIAIAAYSIFYFAYVPTRGFSVPVHLQFPTTSTAINSRQQYGGSSSSSSSNSDRSFAEWKDELCLGLGVGAQQREQQAVVYHPWGTAGGLRPWLVSDQGYDVRVELEMPRTRANREAGNFMVELALLGPPGSSSSGTTVGSGIVGAYSSSEGMEGGGKKKNKAEEVVLAVSQRPAILTWYSDVVENVNKAIELPWYLLGWRREAERLTVGMMEGVRFERGWQNLPEALRVEIRAVERLQVYAVRVVFEAKLRGLRYIMYNYRLISALVFTTLFWIVELTFMILAWLALSQMFSPVQPHSAKAIKSEKEQTTKPDEEETEIDLNKIKTEEPETEETTDVPDLSDTPRTFPTYRGQQPLRYESPRVKSEDEDDGPTAESAGGVGGAPEQEADDEDDEDADFVLDTAGRYMERDSGLGTSMESGHDRRRDAVRKRRSGFFSGSGGGGE